MVGQVTTQGDRAMSSDVARLLFNLDGSGITIGIISDSFNTLSGADADITSGDLPGASNPNGYTTSVNVLQEGDPGDTDEGRAMAQIIHDIAPGANLLFHAGPDLIVGETDGYIQAIDTLVSAGADIIIDDLGVIEPLFQDGELAQKINEVVDQGVIYFSAAGNADNDSYESAFRPGETIAVEGEQYLMHDFDPGVGVDTDQSITLKGGSFFPYLQWNQPFGQATTDLDFFLYDEAGNLLDSSINDVGVDPLDYFSTAYEADPNETVFLRIGKRIDTSAPNQTPNPSLIKWVDARGTVDNLEYATNSSSLFGHVNADGTIAVGASDFKTTPAFGNRGLQLEEFSSQGGTPILFDSNGNLLEQPEIRNKPEIVGPDNTDNTFFGLEDPDGSGFLNFLGTSAAAPHLAAIAALLLQRAGGPGKLTAAQVKALLQETALEMDPQPNFTTGAGFVQADKAVLQAALKQKTGNAKDNQIRGTKEADNLFGMEGKDRLLGAEGNDGLFGAKGRDRLWGEAGNDLLLGNTGKDELIGGEASDVLVGGRNDDALTGGKGKDVFFFNDSCRFCTKNLGVDGITDFKLNETIALSTHTFASLENAASSPEDENPSPIVPFGSNPSFTTVKTVKQARQNAAEITYIRRTGAIYYNPNSAEAGFGYGGQFATVDSGLKLTAANFEIVMGVR